MAQELTGRRILITRSSHQSSEFRTLLERLGAEVLEAPTIEQRPRPNHEIDPAASHPEAWDWLIFTSANAVRFFLERCRELGSLSRCLGGSGPRIGAVGPATADAIYSFGVEVDLLPETFQAEGVLAAFQQLEIDLKGRRVLLPIAGQAREILASGLERLGAAVQVLPVYDTVLPEDAAFRLRQSLEHGPPDLVVFTSSSTAQNFVALCRPEIDPRRFRYAAIGLITAQTCREWGIPASVIAETSTVRGLVEAIRDYFA